MKSGSYVHYGCGLSAPEKWLNFDVSPTLRFQKIPILGSFVARIQNTNFPKNVEYGDIVKGLPLASNSCKGIYCSHVLEHLSLNDFRIALKNSYVILESGGTFRMVLPDLEYAAKKYIENLENTDSANTASIDFVGNDTLLGMVERPKGFLDKIRSIYGNANHLWMWDFYSLSNELQQAGFREIRKCQFNDSTDMMFELVESEGRFKNALAIECKK